MMLRDRSTHIGLMEMVRPMRDCLDMAVSLCIYLNIYSRQKGGFYEKGTNR